MVRKIHKNRFTDRKLKKALKNHPCKKTKRGRYIIEVLDSYYDHGGVCIGCFDGYEVVEYDRGYEHPYGEFFFHMINDIKPLWSMDDEVFDKIYNKHSDDFNQLDENLSDRDLSNNLFPF